MIPDLHRTKGGAAQLGVRPGLPGPFGTWSEDEDTEEPHALDNVYTAPPAFFNCLVVRITPYAGDGDLAHDQATSYQATEPLTCFHSHRTRTDDITSSTSYWRFQPLAGLVGFTAPRDQGEPDIIRAISRKLRDHRGTYVAVDMWMPMPGLDDDLWLHGLVPRWSWLDASEAEDIRPPRHQILVAGEAMAVVQDQRWPHPALGEYVVPRGAQLRVSIDATPPPACSLASRDRHRM